MFEQIESRIVLEVLQVCEGARAQVIDAKDTMPFREQSVAKMGTEEACGTGNQHFLLLHVKVSPKRSASILVPRPLNNQYLDRTLMGSVSGPAGQS